MDAKLNHSDLSLLLAKATEMSGAKAEAFTKAFFDIIIEGLEKDGSVKVNGLGTFKITDVASRGSVDVNTGEKIEIKGHKKLTFLPADTLKDKVNQPFAMFEPVEVDDSYVEEETNEEEVAVEEPSAEETPEEPAATAEEPVADAPVVEKNAPAEEPSVPKEQKVGDTDKNIEPVQKGKKWVYIIIPIIIMCIAVVALYMHKMQGETPAVANIEPVAKVVEQKTDVVSPDTITADTTAVSVEKIEEPYKFEILEELANKPTRSITISDTLLYYADGEITTHTVTADETLARIALTYYGDRKLWPYIVQYNKLSNPNGLAKGMPLVIPCLFPR